MGSPPSGLGNFMRKTCTGVQDQENSLACSSFTTASLVTTCPLSAFLTRKAPGRDFSCSCQCPRYGALSVAHSADRAVGVAGEGGRVATRDGGRKVHSLIARGWRCVGRHATTPGEGRCQV